MPKIEKSEWSKLHIAKINNWIVSVCSDQHVLGWLILFPPRKVEGSLVDLSDQELLEFKKVATVAQELLKEGFNAEWFNYVQAGNVVKSLHIHLQPRYSTNQIFENTTFTDEGWGHPVKYVESSKLASNEVVFSIVDKLKNILRNKVVEGLSIEVL